MLLAGDNGRLSCVAAHRLGGGGSFERADGDTEFHRALRLVRQGGEVRGDVRGNALPASMESIPKISPIDPLRTCSWINFLNDIIEKTNAIMVSNVNRIKLPSALLKPAMPRIYIIADNVDIIM